MRPNMTGDWPNGPRIMRMPAAIGSIFISFLTTTGLLVGAVNLLGFTGVGILALGVGYAATFGAALLLQSAFRKEPATPKPSDVQTNIRQEISPRRRIYSRYLTGSIIVFGFRRGEKSYILHYIGEGPIKQYVGFRLDKKPVELNEAGYVTDEQYRYNGSTSKVQILSTLGLATDEPFQAILDAFPELDTPLTPFRHRGCAMVLQIVEQVAAERIADVYPNNMPSLQVVVDGLDDIPDPATGTRGFTDNAGRCLLAEVCDVYGLDPFDDTAVAVDAWADFVAHCNEQVLLKAGGAEDRYRAAGVILMNAENESRISALASVCNADVYMDARGRVAVREKLRSTPAIALRAKNGDHLTVQLEGGRTLQKGFNTVKVTYVDPSLNWKANELRWQHASFLEDDGQEYSEQLNAAMCPSPTQAQRLAKLFLHGANPEFVGQMTSQSWWLDGHTGFIAGELVDKPAESGVTGGERVQNLGLSLASQTDLDIGLVPARDLAPSADRLHFSGASLVTLGERYGRAAMMPTPALPRLTRTQVVSDGLFLTVDTSGADFSDLGDLFEFLATLMPRPRARVQTTIKAGQWEIPAYASFPIGWAHGNNFEFYGEVDEDYAAPVTTDWGGTAATDLAMLQGKFLTELVATTQGMIVCGNGGYWKQILITGDDVGGAANHGIRMSEPQIPSVGGGRIKLEEAAVHGFSNASAAAIFADTPMSYIRAVNSFVSHSGMGIYANGCRVDANNMVMGYIAGVKNTATYNATVLARNQKHVGGDGTAFQATRNGALDATGSDNTSSTSTATGGTVWTA